MLRTRNDQWSDEGCLLISYNWLNSTFDGLWFASLQTSPSRLFSEATPLLHQPFMAVFDMRATRTCRRCTRRPLLRKFQLIDIASISSDHRSLIRQSSFQGDPRPRSHHVYMFDKQNERKKNQFLCGKGILSIFPVN